MSAMHRPDRAHEMTRVYTVMTCLGVVVILQLVLLLVSIETFLSGEHHSLLPAAIASGVCFAGANWLVRYILPRRA